MFAKVDLKGGVIITEYDGIVTFGQDIEMDPNDPRAPYVVEAWGYICVGYHKPRVGVCLATQCTINL